MSDWADFGGSSGGNNSSDFNDDGFGSADVFGKDVGDVDVWKNGDSFGADDDWDFDDDEDNADHRGGSRSKSSRGDKSSSDRRSRRPKLSTDKERDRDRLREKIEKRKSKTSTSSSKTSSSSRRGSSREREKPSRSSRPSLSREGSNSDFQGFPITDDRDGFEANFSSNTSQASRDSSSKKRAETDAFDPFAPFEGDPFAQTSEKKDRTSRSSRRGDSGRRQAYTDDVIQSSFQTTKRITASRSSTKDPRLHRPPPPLVRKRDGNVGYARPSEKEDHRHRARQSTSRRSTVKDSLFSFIDDEGDDDFGLPPKPAAAKKSAPPPRQSLGGFLDNKRSMAKQSDSGSVGSAHKSVSSAPPTAGIHQVVPQSARTGKSKRWSKSSRLPPTARDSPKVHKQPLAINVAQEGFIEVVDGKMRLVFEVDK
jgi:hypothetical protein